MYIINVAVLAACAKARIRRTKKASGGAFGNAQDISAQKASQKNGARLQKENGDCQRQEGS